MKRILATACDDPEAVYKTAFLVAEKFDAHVVALGGRCPRQKIMAWNEAAGQILVEGDLMLEREEEERCRKAREAFRSIVNKREVATESISRSCKGPSAEWMHEVGPHEQNVETFGRTFDLIVVEQPPRAASFARARLDGALLETGRPVLMAPTKPGDTIGEIVMVVWRGSTECARSIALAMPFLKKSKRVEIVSIQSGAASPSRLDLERSMSAHAIPVSSRSIAPGGAASGEALCSEAKSLGADLMIAGAYTHSPLREMILGGITGSLIAAADIPVLFAH